MTTTADAAWALSAAALAIRSMAAYAIGDTFVSGRLDQRLRNDQARWRRSRS